MAVWDHLGIPNSLKTPQNTINPEVFLTCFHSVRFAPSFGPQEGTSNNFAFALCLRLELGTQLFPHNFLASGGFFVSIARIHLLTFNP